MHSLGRDPDRVLIVGDGVATGRGVLTHDLGLSGFLARALTRRSGHATDVELIADSRMTVYSSIPALSHVDLTRFDVIVLSIGFNEALSLTRISVWRTALSELLAYVISHKPVATRLFVLSIPYFGPRTHLPRILANTVDARARKLNDITRTLVSLSDVKMVPVGDRNEFEKENAHVYGRWAESIAASISTELDAHRRSVHDTAPVNELARREAARALAGDGKPDAVLDLLIERARAAFGTSIAAITLIHGDHQTMEAAVGMERVEINRLTAICDITIRRATHLVIEDTLADDRYAGYAAVEMLPPIRFYAGYPIESSDGFRVGAFCVMDSTPRQFTDLDLDLLRALALRAQHHLAQRSRDLGAGRLG